MEWTIHSVRGLQIIRLTTASYYKPIIFIIILERSTGFDLDNTCIIGYFFDALKEAIVKVSSSPPKCVLDKA